LLVERDYEAITVQEITERADLNRATFYHHFNHKDELLALALETRFDELVASFGELPTGEAGWDDITPDVMTFRHVAEHAALYRVLLSERGLCPVVYRIINYIARFTHSKMLPTQPALQHSAIPNVVMAYHAAGSLFALLSWWVNHNMPYSPEEMAQMTHDLCTYGIAAQAEAGPSPTLLYKR
jgi:AcrR family transcriptional regulator